MSIKKYFTFLFTILGCLLAVTSYAQIDQFEVSFPYRYNSTLVAQDEEGYIWFPNPDETEFFRFNGQGLDALGLLKLAPNSAEAYIADQTIFMDLDLLLHTKLRVSLFDFEAQKIRSSWQIPADQLIDFVYQDDTGAAWVFTSSQKDSTRPVYRSEDGAAFNYAFDLAIHFGEEPLSWWSMLRDANGLLYFHNTHGELLILNDQGVTQSLDLADPQEFQDKYECSAFRLDNNNVLWRMYDKDFSTYDKSLRAFISHPISNKFTAYVDCPESYKQGILLNFIYTDYKGRIWLGGGDSNLFMYDVQKNETLSFGKTIVDGIGGRGGSVHSLIGDGKGNIYGAKRGGVFKISEKKSYFESYAVDTKDRNHAIYETKNNPHLEQVIHLLSDELIINTEIQKIQEDAAGNIYFVDPRFAFKLNQTTRQLEILPFFDPFAKINLFISEQHKIISMWSSFISFDDQNQITRYLDKPQRLENIFTQKNGDVWFTGYRKINYQTGESIGLFAKVEPATLSIPANYQDSAGIVDFDDFNINSIDEDQDGNLWIGAHQGLYEIAIADDGAVINKGNVFSYQDQKIELEAKDGIFVEYLNDNRLGIHTNKLICILNTSTNQIEKYISIDNLNIEKVLAVCFVEQDAVWISSFKSISYYEFSNELLLHFSANEGYSSPVSERAMKKLNNGKIAVGTENGLFLFDPEELIKKYEQNAAQNQNTPLRLNSFSYFQDQSDSIQRDQYFNASVKPIELAHNAKMMQFDYTLMDFQHTDHHKFSYWLEGYDQQWSKPISDHTITFTSLPPGNYTLMARGHNGDGIWTEDILSIPIHIHTAWFRSWWFISACILAFLTLAFFILKHYLFLEKDKLDRKLKIHEAERLKELDRAKNLFFTNITHEFRTPLTVIMGVNENSEAKAPEKSLIKRNSNHLLHLINQILDLSKLESKKLQLHNTQDDIIAYLKYLTASFYSLASDKNIQLEFRTTLDELTMNYDEVRIQQIIYNLLSNAIKFTPEAGKVSVHLDQFKKPDSHHLMIRVTDTGSGIPKGDIPHLFDHFYQVSNDVTKLGEGTGIGLSLTRELLEIMNGEIRVESIMGQGTEILVLLPIINTASETLVPATFNTKDFKLNPLILAETADPKKAALNIEIENLLTNQTKPILLLIEDNPDVVTYICSILDEAYQIVISINGDQGIQKAIEIIPDIIISDVMMPIKDGYEVCNTIKQNKLTDHIPIILLTAKATIEDKIEGLKYGADAYINKPFNKEELLIRLEQLLIVRKKMQERYAKEMIQQTTINTQPTDQFIHTLYDTINAHLSDSSFGVPELAQNLFMSQTQVFRKTKALVNQTPLILIRSLRLAKSQELLKVDTMKISEIAKQTGFSNPNYFSRAFQQEFGTSPTDFRRKHSKNKVSRSV